MGAIGLPRHPARPLHVPLGPQRLERDRLWVPDSLQPGRRLRLWPGRADWRQRGEAGILLAWTGQLQLERSRRQELRHPRRAAASSSPTAPGRRGEAGSWIAGTGTPRQAPGRKRAGLVRRGDAPALPGGSREARNQNVARSGISSEEGERRPDGLSVQLRADGPARRGLASSAVTWEKPNNSFETGPR